MSVPTSKELFINAFNLKPNPRPPIWIMRQAGRYLPEYRKLKETYDFLTLAQTPELAAEVTLQPLRRFSLDAAIIFSDILIVPEAMGQPYHFRDKGGIGMDYTLETSDQIKALDPSGVRQKLNYLPEAMKWVAREIASSQKALLGFGGSPWTLATYMVEGGSSKEFGKIKSLFFKDPPLFHQLMEKLVEAIVELFHMQIEAGANAIQIFDSWGSIAPGDHYWECSLWWIHEIIQRLPKDFPVILYAKGMSHHLHDLQRTGARCLSIDQSASIKKIAQQRDKSTSLQGNLDPVLMTLPPEITQPIAQNILDSMHGQAGYIFNLGHGITPDAKIETVQAVVDTVTQFNSSK